MYENLHKYFLTGEVLGQKGKVHLNFWAILWNACISCGSTSSK